MQSLSEIRALLDERGLRPRRRLGQNFLHDKNQLHRLLEAAAVAPGDLVLEVGPGTGTLTEALLEAGAEVIACELDEGLASLVEDRLGERITLVRGDCLERRRLASPLVEAIGGRPFQLVANLPYQVASALMATLLIDRAGCTAQTVTIQKEVADRLLASPGTKAYGPLGIIVQAMGEVRRIGVVGPQCFWPVPEVTSAIVRIVPRPGPGLPADPPAFARFVTELFGRRRKQLGAIFGRDRVWPEGIEPSRRPETLTIDRLVALYDSVS